MCRVPTQTGKPGKMEKLFSSQGKVREFCADWKSQGNLDKILEKSGKFREFLFFVLFLIELYFFKMDQVFSFQAHLVGCPQWLSNLGKAGVPQPVPVFLVQIVYWIYC